MTQTSCQPAAFTFGQQQLMAVLLAPASWFQIPRVGVGPEVVAFWVTVEMEPHPVTLDLPGRERALFLLRGAAGGDRAHGPLYL